MTTTRKNMHALACQETGESMSGAKKQQQKRVYAGETTMDTEFCQHETCAAEAEEQASNMHMDTGTQGGEMENNQEK